MLLPDLLQVVFLHGKPLVMLECTRFTDEDAEVHHEVGGFVFHAVDTEPVEFVVNHLLCEIGD